MAKAKIKSVDREASKLHIYKAMFGDVGTVVMSAEDLFPEVWVRLSDVQKALIFNGLTQKLNDSHAGAESQAEAFDWTQDTAEMLTAGKWTIRVPGEGGPRGGDFYRAVAEFKGITEAEAREKIADMIDNLMAEDEKITEKMGFARIKAAILKKYPAVQETINRMKQEKNQKVKTIDVDL